MISHYTNNHKESLPEVNPITKRRKVGFTEEEWKKYRFNATLSLCESDNAITFFKKNGTQTLFKAVLGTLTLKIW